VLRLRAGDAFVAFDPASGLECDAEIVRADEDALVARFANPRAGTRAPARAITLVQGLAKGEKLDAIVRDATELGAARVIPAVTSRSVVRLDAERAASK